MPLPDGSMVSILAERAFEDDVYLRFVRVGGTWIQVASRPRTGVGPVGTVIAFAFAIGNRAGGGYVIKGGPCPDHVDFTCEERDGEWVAEVRDA